MICRLIFLLTLLTGTTASALEDPTGGQPFFPWIWHDQIKPTLLSATEASELSVLATGVAATVVSHQYDPDVEDGYGANKRMPPSISKYGSILGSGAPEITIAVLQLLFDQKNGLSTTRSIVLTSLTAITIAELSERERPNHANHLSFPSGHTSSAFTTATSLAYEYGVWAAIPAYATATFVAASRIADDDHWFSDTVSAAALGIFWARASALANSKMKDPIQSFYPVIIPGGALVSFSRTY